MGHRHITRRKTQFNVVQAVARGVFNVFPGNTAAGFQRSQHLHAPIKFRQEANQVWFIAGDLHMRTQRFKGICRESNIELAAKIENGLGTDVADRKSVV